MPNLGHGGDRSKAHQLRLENVTREQAAKKFGVSVSAIAAFRAIKDPELVRRMKIDEINLWQAVRAQAEVIAKEAQRAARQARKAAPGGNGAQPDKKKPKPDPKAPKTTRAYAIKTLNEAGALSPTQDQIEKIMEGFRKLEEEEAEQEGPASFTSLGNTY